MKKFNNRTANLGKYAQKGWKITDEQRQARSNAAKRRGSVPPSPLGRKMSEKTKELLRIAHKGKKLSEEHKHKLSVSHRGLSVGEKHWGWKGGVTPINEKIRKSVEYKLWRTAVFERDRYTCIWCGARSGSGIKVTLNADHIKPFCDYPELRFAIDNGRTLCVDCHKKTDNYKRKRPANSAK